MLLQNRKARNLRFFEQLAPELECEEIVSASTLLTKLISVQQLKDEDLQLCAQSSNSRVQQGMDAVLRFARNELHPATHFYWIKLREIELKTES